MVGEGSVWSGGREESREKGSGRREREWEGKPDCKMVIVWMRGI